jgi:hypothetical protein
MILRPTKRNKHHQQNTRDEADASSFRISKKWKYSPEKKLTHRMQRFIVGLERSKLEEFVAYLISPRKILWSNFLAGLARGLGFGLGVAILGDYHPIIAEN